MKVSTENKRRANTALDAVNSQPDAPYNDLRENIVDLVTNLRHLCNQQSIDFDAVVRISEQHWQAERP